jgi:hypothetical protein
MGRVTHEPCPECRRLGRDRRGDNFGRYPDGSGHCWACGHHEHPKGVLRKAVFHVDANEGVLPRDFTREVPAKGWKWLLQFGLPYSYWKAYTGYSPAMDRLVITHGEPVATAVGRYLGDEEGQAKWRQWGDKAKSAHVLGLTDSKEIVVVEDIVSAHKVAQVCPTLPLFGTSLYPKAISTLRALKRPVALWLDEDVWGYLPGKINRLQAFLDVPVRFIRTRKDPKGYSLDEVKEILL